MHNRIFAVAVLAFAPVRWPAALFAIALFVTAGAAHGGTPDRDLTRALHFLYRARDGRMRPAWLLLPSSYHGTSIPLVISPHGRGVGAGGNARFWGDLPGEGGFAVVNPGGEGRRLHQYSWGDPGQIADLARMPAIVRQLGVRVDPHRVYAIGGSMGGQETLLLVAQHPGLLAGAVAFDPATDMARRYRDFARLRGGGTLRQLARLELGGSPSQVPNAYRQRSPDAYVDAIAFSGVPLQIYWSTRDRIISDQLVEAAQLAAQIRLVNPAVKLWDFQGAWNHTAEMQSNRRLPRALARFGLLPWRDVPRLPEPLPTREPVQTV
jgi:poly(3-hydroxybutyrate) depolymerase